MPFSTSSFHPALDLPLGLLWFKLAWLFSWRFLHHPPAIDVPSNQDDGVRYKY